MTYEMPVNLHGAANPIEVDRRDRGGGNWPIHSIINCRIHAAGKDGFPPKRDRLRRPAFICDAEGDVGVTKTILEQGFEAQAASLREFGYPDVTAEHVSTAHRAWMKNEEPSDVVAMFCERAFAEHPMIFGKRDRGGDGV